MALSKLTQKTHKGRGSIGTLSSLLRKTHKGRGSKGSTSALTRGANSNANPGRYPGSEKPLR